MERIAIGTPLPVGNVNAYFLPGRVPTLIDAGPDLPEALDAIRDGLAAAGASMADLRQVVVTHSHVDHCGLAAQLHARSGALVIAHRAAARVLRDFDAAWARRSAFYAQAAVAAAVPPDVRQSFLAAYEARRALGSSVPPRALLAVPNHAAVTIGDEPWSVHYTPGHARDHLCLYHERSHSLFCGDLLLRYLHTVPVLAPRSPGARDATALGQLVSSWRAVGRLAVDIAWPGHGAPIRAHRILVARRLVTVRARLKAARAAVQNGAETVWEVSRALGLPDAPEGLDLTLSEAAALLDWLARRGEIARRRTESVVTYAPTPPASAPRPGPTPVAPRRTTGSRP